MRGKKGTVIAMAVKRLLERLKGYNTISIIGMDKNTGKTTVLNHVLESGRGEYRFGLTSIGWDGESIDQVTHTEKPGIYVESGTLMATAQGCLSRSDITIEVAGTTGINTPMGEVIIVRALSDGNVELAGPSTTSGVTYVCRELLSLGAYPVLVDGALSRKASASPSVTEGVILSTGASLSRDMDKVVDETAYMVKLLTLKREENLEVKGICGEIFKDSRAGIIYRDGSYRIVKILTTLESFNEIAGYIDDMSEYIAVKGIVTDKFLAGIMNSPDLREGVTLLVEDGTKIFAGREMLHRFEKRGNNVKVMEGINLLCITSNPKSPYGYEFERELFLNRLSENIPLPVYDVIGGD